MTVKEILEQVQQERKAFDNLCEKREDKFYKSINMTVPTTNINVTTSRKNNQEIMFIKLADADTKAKEQFTSYIMAYARALSLIGLLHKYNNNSEEIDVIILIMRYLNGSTWTSISEFLKCDRSFIYRHHNKSLLIIKKMVLNIVNSK